MQAVTDILVADDSDRDARLTLYALRRSAPEMSALRVRDGDQALQFIFSEGGYAGRPAGLPRLILLDHYMPVVQGLSVLRSLRAQPSTESLPVVLWTASSNPLLISEAFELGASDYRIKPATVENYCAEIDRLVQTWLRVPAEDSIRSGSFVPSRV
jgi:two-component system, response regulator